MNVRSFGQPHTGQLSGLSRSDLPSLASNGRGGEICEKSSYHTKEQNRERKHGCDRGKCVPRLPPSAMPYAASINAPLLCAVEDIALRVEKNVSLALKTTAALVLMFWELGRGIW